MTPRRRSVAVLAVVAGSISACDARPPDAALLATAHQVGPVGYRDPAGAVSPDGHRLAYSEGRHIVVQEIDGTGRRTLGPAPSQVRYLTWLPDSRGVLVHERSFDRRRQDWFVYDADTGEKVSLWGGGPFPDHLPRSAELLELSWSPDGDWLVGARRRGERSQVWRLAADGRDGELLAEGSRLSHPVVSPAGDVACIERRGGVQRLRLPCREGPVGWMEDHQPYGQVAFSPDGQAIYYAAPGDDGALDLWARPVGWGEARRLATAERDAYGPSVTRDGNVVYRTQRYMVSISATPAAGGEPTRITTFQSETPSWSPSGDELSFTFGGWRLATDDVEYPDIDQQIGIVDANSRRPKSTPDRVVRESYSEDQGMHWSPNGRWIAYHSHVDGTDDIYIVAAGDSIVAAGDSLAVPRLISSGGRETGWPRWSPDGRWIAFPTYVHAPSGARRSVLQLIPVDQETGATQPQRRLAIGDFRHDALQAEWMPDSRRLVFEAAEGAGRKALYWIPVESEEGGTPTRFHEWDSEQVHSGIAVSPDGAWVAYVGPGDTGFFQIHRVPFGGGRAEQLTTDPSHKTQPAYDPSGARLAYAVFEYQARFWMLASEEAPSPDAPLDGVVDAGEETTPPGWPLEIGDTITTVALRDLMRRFRPMGWTDATYLARNPEHHKERIRKSKYGIAVFEFAFVEVPRDYKHSTTYACPPPGFVLYPGAEVLTTDGAIVSNDLPTDSPCDPDKRFAGGSIYVGQVR